MSIIVVRESFSRTHRLLKPIRRKSCYFVKWKSKDENETERKPKSLDVTKLANSFFFTFRAARFARHIR